MEHQEVTPALRCRRADTRTPRRRRRQQRCGLRDRPLRWRKSATISSATALPRVTSISASTTGRPGRQVAGDALADAVAGARDERHLAVQVHGHGRNGRGVAVTSAPTRGPGSRTAWTMLRCWMGRVKATYKRRRPRGSSPAMAAGSTTTTASNSRPGRGGRDNGDGPGHGVALGLPDFGVLRQAGLARPPARPGQSPPPGRIRRPAGVPRRARSGQLGRSRLHDDGVCAPAADR